MNYLYHEEQIDERKPACYLLTYRGRSYYSCYGITLETWLEYLFDLKGEEDRV
jgi:hypothetical protein